MRTAGIVLILCGAFVIYSVLHGRLASVSVSAPSSGGGGGGSGGGSGVTYPPGVTNPDPGSHQGVDLTGAATGVIGSVYSIDAAYGDMSAQQQDDANAYARSIGNAA